MTHPHEGLQERALREVLDAACDGLVDEVAGMIGADQRQRIALSYAEAEMRNRLASLSLPQQAVTDEGAKIAAAIKATEYKYFGDYEMSDEQREAVDVLVETAKRYALSTPTAQPPAAETRLRRALEPFAALKMGDDADCKTEIVPNGYSDPRDWRNHIRQARAALTQPEPTAQADERSCTCHPDDRPETCQKRYAATDCQQEAGEAEAVEIIEWLKAIREVVREAHFALDDSEDRSHESPPINAVPRDNAERLNAALEACEAYCPDGEAWNGPGPLVTKIIDRIETLHAISRGQQVKAIKAWVRDMALDATRETAWVLNGVATGIERGEHLVAPPCKTCGGYRYARGGICWTCEGSGREPSTTLDEPATPQPTETQRIVAAGGEREGPAPIPNTRLQCFGCKHLDTEDWREPSGDGETFDSGTSARCKAIPTEHGGQVIGSYWSRTNDAPKWCPFLPANPASGEHLAGEEQ